MVNYGNQDYERPDWAGKERRMVRMNSNTNATAIVVALINRGSLVGAADAKDFIIQYSEFFEGLVYKGFEEKKVV